MIEKCKGVRVVDPKTDRESWVYTNPLRYYEGEKLGDVLAAIESQISSGDLTLNERVTVVIKRDEMLEP